MKEHPTAASDVSNSFVARHQAVITGVLHCWDRVRFSGTVRTLQSVPGLMGYLWQKQVLLKNFKDFTTELTSRVRREGEALAKAAGRPISFLRGSGARKEELAREAAERDGVREGLIGLWTSTEPCLTYFLRRDAQRRELRLEFAPGKCLHHYFYFLHPLYGLMHLRLQTWFPFNVTLCLNGHEWLARQMDAEGLGYGREENCFRWLENPRRAQALADLQQHTEWARMLEGILQEYFPSHREICAPIGQPYYWSAKETEYSSDVLFASPQALARIYPRLVRHGIEQFESREVLRFLGKRVPAQGVHGAFEQECVSSFQARPEGVRIKHTAAGNSLKMYDKQGSVLRTETTINKPGQFRVYREAGTDPQPAWRPMRKGVADMHRRAAVSRASNERYLEAMAQVETDRPAGEVTETVFRAVVRHGRRARALNPWTKKDAQLLEAISDGAWTINGFRNRDLREKLFGSSSSKAQARQQAAKITRLLALLRAHRLIKKVTGTHRYLLTESGRQITAALHAARQASFVQLQEVAA